MPMLDWADQDILWTEMLKKEDKYQHSPHIMENHSKLQPGMRAVLMEWLMEVRNFFIIIIFFNSLVFSLFANPKFHPCFSNTCCQMSETKVYMSIISFVNKVCQLHTLQKETYYLAVDYIDRYLMKTEDIQPSELQLIGITALFLASKVEVSIFHLL